jgi:multimeric flavodoxin WrbA
MALTALALNCTLKHGDSPSSTDLMLRQLCDELERHDVGHEIVRVADHDIKPGVTADEGDGDEWPQLRAKILDADIVVLGTPIWLGAPSSVAKRVVERLDAMLAELDDHGRMPTFGKVAVVAVVGNEDGAHHVAAECFQWLNDVGFTIPAAGSVYWVGEAMGSTDYQDLDETPESVASSLAMTASTASHLARLLREERYAGT